MGAQFEPQESVASAECHAAAVRISGVCFRFPKTEFELSIDQWTVDGGQHVAVIGPSGSGKTTLLHLLAGIYEPLEGEINIGAVPVHRLADAARRDLRLRQIGFVFQNFELVEYLNVQENIVLPYLVSGSLKISADVWSRAAELAESVGLEQRLNRNVRRLSHGEQQRVALCRALMIEPTLILADEPTGNLDPAAKTQIVDLLHNHARRLDATLIMVTHDQQLLSGMDAVHDFASINQSV